MIAANRFFFISTPGFGDFVVANATDCSGAKIIQLRSIATSDNPECRVNSRTGAQLICPASIVAVRERTARAAQRM
jgi:hypothetical protein